MFGADKGTASRLEGRKLVIGIVQARFNQRVTNALAKACWDELLARGVEEKHIDHVQVPGALEVPVRVHEPLSLLDALEVDRAMHSWSLDASLKHIAGIGHGVAVLLNCGESAEQLLAQFEGTARASHAPERGRMDLRSYGVGAQILRECGVQRMNLMGTPRRMPSMAGYGLEVAGYTPRPNA